ncbi:hypothetical protein DL96DRAFT_1424379, partial [Flagelloscypha sp. PMI_526]
PNIEEARRVHDAIDTLLRPKRGKKGYKDPQDMDKTTKKRLEAMRACLNLYLERCKLAGVKPGLWTRASEDAALSKGMAKSWGVKLRLWCRGMMEDLENVPMHQFGKSGMRSAVDDEDISAEIKTHLQSQGKYISAETIVKFCATPDMLKKMGRTKTISKWTARRWLMKMGYRWKKHPR